MTPRRELGANYREYHGMADAKATWGDGPWDAEPDKAQWIDAETDLDCLIVRNRYGSLCGYVGLPESHPLFGESYHDMDVQTHGGLTYADLCVPLEVGQGEATTICHVPGEGRPDHVWWLGFDCGHAWDLAPGMVALLESIPNLPQPDPKLREFEIAHETYRNWDYVVGQVRFLASQLRGHVK